MSTCVPLIIYQRSHADVGQCVYLPGHKLPDLVLALILVLVPVLVLVLVLILILILVLEVAAWLLRKCTAKAGDSSRKHGHQQQDSNTI